MRDLLGEEIAERFIIPGEKPGEPHYFTKRKPTQRRGYAWRPGTGPEGQTCATCKFAERYRRWAKCGHKSAPKHTGGKGTDIRLRAPSCKFWEAANAGG